MFSFVCVLTWSLKFRVKKSLGHAQISLFWGFNSKFPTSIRTTFICGVPPARELHACVQTSPVFFVFLFPRAKKEIGEVCTQAISTAKLAVLHGSSTTWFQTSRYCRAKVEFNSINLVRHGISTTFETGLSSCE